LHFSNATNFYQAIVKSAKARKTLKTKTNQKGSVDF